MSDFQPTREESIAYHQEALEELRTKPVPIDFYDRWMDQAMRVYHQMQLKYLLDESEPYIPLNSDDVLQIIRSQGYFVCFAENEDA